MLILASPLWAEDRPAPNFDTRAMAVPGAVATLVSAERLHDLGLAAKDPLMVLAAARMLRGVKLVAADRKAEGGTRAPARAVPPKDTAQRCRPKMPR